MAAKLDAYKIALKEASKKNANNKKVFALLNQSLDKRDPRAAYALGTWYLYGKHVEKNIRKGIKLIRQAAEKNVPDALYDLAVSYETGDCLPKNKKLAAEYYLRAALYGEKQSIYEVGRCYYYGIGVPKDRRLAKVWFDRAKELGVPGEFVITPLPASETIRDSVTSRRTALVALEQVAGHCSFAQEFCH